MNDSILKSIKKLLGLEADYTVFDEDVKMHINSAFMILNQLGVGPEEGYIVTSDLESWKEFVGNEKDLQLVKSYVYLKVRLLFDPPANSFLVTAMEKQVTEYEWRLNVQIENGGFALPVIESEYTP